MDELHDTKNSRQRDVGASCYRVTRDEADRLVPQHDWEDFFEAMEEAKQRTVQAQGGAAAPAECDESWAHVEGLD